ncbi:MAG: hypothetical protein ACFE9V_16995 [Candidatus Hodarchaeota archaeon]
MDYNASYSWIEISTTGTLMNISNENDGYEVLSFNSDGWNFTYYETQYDTVYVSTNGWISLTNLGDTQFKCAPIPDLSNENIDCVALLCSDLNPINGGEIYYEFRGLAPNNYLVIEYRNIFSDDNNYVGNFEVIFNRSGMIKFQYQNINYLNQYDAIVGLDHGDLINYNIYSGINKNNLPYTNKAIEFTFNEISEIDYSLNVSINKEYTWIVAEIDNLMMNQIFGSDWESTYGIFTDPEKFTKFKINITAIIENSTHWNINYSMWNWTYKENNFNNTPDGNDLLIFRKEPLNYTSPHNLTHIFPFFIPNPIFHYLNRSNLAESYSRISSFGSAGDYVELGDIIMSSTIIGGHNIQFGRNAHYNKYGILDWMDFYYVNQSWESTDKKSIFTIYNFFESSKPSFIGVNESDIYNYGVFYSERNAPQIPLRNYSKMPNIFSLKIDFIGGFDPYFNRSLVIINNSDAASAIDPYPAGKHPEIYYLPQNLTRFTLLKRFILPTEINWSLLESIRSDIIAISNGFIISLNIMDDIFEFEYTYTSFGLLNTYSEYYNGKEYFTVRFNKFNYQFDDYEPDKRLIMFLIFTVIIASAVAVSGPSFYYYRKIYKRKTRDISPLFEGDEETYQSWLGPSAKEILNIISNKKLIFDIINQDELVKKEVKLTTMNIEVLRKIDALGFDEYDKREFLREILALSPKERYEIIRNIMSRQSVGSEQFSKEILSKLSYKDLLLQIFDETTPRKKRIQLEKIELTIVSEKFLNKVDAIGLTGDSKIKFIKEMLALSPKEREEIINNILDKKETYS